MQEGFIKDSAIKLEQPGNKLSTFIKILKIFSNKPII